MVSITYDICVLLVPGTTVLGPKLLALNALFSPFILPKLLEFFNFNCLIGGSFVVIVISAFEIDSRGVLGDMDMDMDIDIFSCSFSTSRSILNSRVNGRFRGMMGVDWAEAEAVDCVWVVVG